MSLKNKIFGIILLTGPRRAGKSTLAKKLLSLWEQDQKTNPLNLRRYVSFDTPDTVSEFKNDPLLFMQSLAHPCVLDEIQNVPEIFPYLKADIDKNFKGQIRFILTGSQQFGMMKGVTESLAGRVLIRELLPFTQGEIQETPIAIIQHTLKQMIESPNKITESNDVNPGLFDKILVGGFPPVTTELTQLERRDWFRSYVQTYIQRDVRQLSAIQDLALFNRFVNLLAGRSAKILNYSEIGKELGINYKTAQHYVSIMETGFLWETIPSFYRNTESRVTKSSKGLLRDSGLHCFLTGIYSKDSLKRSPLLGSIVETFAINEVLKINQSLLLDAQFYFFDQASNFEVDLIMELDSQLYLFEFKYASSLNPKFLKGFEKFKKIFPKEKVAACFLMTQNPEIKKLAADTWQIPLSVLWGQ